MSVLSRAISPGAYNSGGLIDFKVLLGGVSNSGGLIIQGGPLIQVIRYLLLVLINARAVADMKISVTA